MEENLEKEVNYSEVEEEIKDKKKEKKEKKMSKEEKKINELEEKLVVLNEKYLYTLAQMKDLHKTYEKENAISVKYVTHDLMLELLPIIDVFSMVLESPNIPSDVVAYFKGFELVFNQFKDLMERHSVSEIKTNVGDNFDHNIHNGVEKVDTENNEEDGKVCAILQKGYKIGDKVLRPVSVKVYSLVKEEKLEQKEENLEATSENSKEDKGE